MSGLKPPVPDALTVVPGHKVNCRHVRGLVQV